MGKTKTNSTTSDSTFIFKHEQTESEKVRNGPRTSRKSFVAAQLTVKPAKDPDTQSTEMSFTTRDGWAHNAFPDDPDFELIVTQVETALYAGVDPQLITAGSSGSYFMKNETGKTIGVFKPKDEEPYGPANPKLKKRIQGAVCPCCFGRGCLIPNHGYLSEAGASLVDEALDLNIVPKTKVLLLASEAFNYKKTKLLRQRTKRVTVLTREMTESKLPPKIGSFQLFVEKYKDANVWLRYFDKNPLPFNRHKEFQFMFEKLVVLDYIIRNTDRGNDNWLIYYMPDEEDSEIHLAAIDNGLAFPVKHPNEIRAYPYYWALLPQAQEPFSEHIQSYILPKLNSEQLVEAMVTDLMYVFKMNRHFKKRIFKGQMAVMAGQIKNLQEALQTRMSPAELVAMPSLVVKTNKSGKLVVTTATQARCKSC